jgi:hypothetical protein
VVGLQGAFARGVQPWILRRFEIMKGHPAETCFVVKLAAVTEVKIAVETANANEEANINLLGLIDRDNDDDYDACVCFWCLISPPR